MSKIKSILIVEDDKSISQALKVKLDKQSFKTQTANNGQEALDILKKEEFDLILLDLIMPKLDGIETLKEMKKMGISSKVIVLSNLGQPEDVDKAKELGASDYFVKAEVSLAEIVEKIKEL